jgi:hypothetical protein
MLLAASAGRLAEVLGGWDGDAGRVIGITTSTD